MPHHIVLPAVLQVWMQDTPTAKSTHERGMKHKENVARSKPFQPHTLAAPHARAEACEVPKYGSQGRGLLSHQLTLTSVCRAQADAGQGRHRQEGGCSGGGFHAEHRGSSQKGLREGPGCSAGQRCRQWHLGEPARSVASHTLALAPALFCLTARMPKCGPAVLAGFRWYVWPSL